MYFADWEGFAPGEWHVFEDAEIPRRLTYYPLSERDAKIHADSLNQNERDIAREAAR